MKPTLHLMVGLPGSGKTTEAKRLEKEQKLIRLTPDDWQLRLFDDDTDDPDHDRCHTETEHIMWELARKLLTLGVSVILDFGFWAREERIFFYEQAKALDAYFEVHFMDVPPEELLRRLALRNQNDAEPSFTVLPSHMESWIPLFQPVTDEELEDYADLKPPAERRSL